MGIWGAIKKTINSTLGTTYLEPLDNLVFKYVHGEFVEWDKAGEYTFIVPFGARKMQILLVGAGGSGGGCGDFEKSKLYNAGGGGGGGSVQETTWTVTPGAILKIKIGKGGVGVDAKDGNGGGFSQIKYISPTSKTNPIVSSTFTANGGYGGKKPTEEGVGGVGGTSAGNGGTGGTGAKNYENPGTSGTAGKYSAGGTSVNKGGGGGGGSLGPGGSATKSSPYANPGIRGGGGAGQYGGTIMPSGNGGDGYCRLTWIV